MSKTLKQRLANGATALIAGAAMLGNAAVANAKPIKIESENIVFYGDNIKPSNAAEAVRNWEIYRRMVFALSGVDNPQPDPEKLTVLGFYDTGDMQKFAGLPPGVVGVYTRGPEGPIFMTAVNKKYTENGAAAQTGMHEYTHHVMHYLVSDGFPRWYDEGFAEYLGTMEISKEVIRVGVPSSGNLRPIERGFIEWISPQTVLGAIDRYPVGTKDDRKKGGIFSFYAQGWLYVHYLRATPKYKNTLGKYVRLLKQPGVDPLKAFEEAHGVSVEQFHEEAIAYYDENKFAIDQYEPGEAFMTVDMDVSALSEEEFAHAQLLGNLTFLSDDNAKVLRRNAKKALKHDPASPRVTAAYVALDLQDENYDLAIRRADAALSARPDDLTLLRSAGLARIAESFDAAVEDIGRYDRVQYKPDETAMEGIDLLKRVLARDEVDYLSIRALTNIYGNSDLEPSRDILKAAYVFEERYMDSVESNQGMNLAMIYAKGGDWEGACQMSGIVRGLNANKSKKETGNIPARLAHFDASFPGECKDGATGN